MAGSHTGRTLNLKHLQPTGVEHALSETPRPREKEELRAEEDEVKSNGALVSYSAEIEQSVSRPGTQGTMSAVNVQDPRSIYADLVTRLSGDAATFKSPALFCESLLQQTERARRMAAAAGTGTMMPPGSVSHASPLQAASACWALDVLAQSAGCKEVLTEIRDALYPCLFIDYGRGYANAPPFIRARFSEAHVASNPYLASDFFFEHFGEARAEVSHLTSTNSVLQGRLRTNVAAVNKVLARLSDHSLRPVFNAWRFWCRRNRVERFARDLTRRHGNRDTRRYVLDGTLSRWRLTVEQRRTVNLKQRVHALEYQLENTKNQFQLQCFRSDKYLRLVEELREELAETRAKRDELLAKTRELQQDLQHYQDRSRDRMNRYVSVLVDELARWRRLARRRIEGEKQRIDQLAFATTGDGATAAEEAGDDDATGTDNTTAEIESQLLAWCSAVLRQAVVSTVKEITNWTSDWHSGEVLLLLMHHVFPGQVPLAPLQEASVSKRVEQVVDIGRKVGVAHLPTANDILEGAGDMMILVAAELYNRNAALNRIHEDVTPYEPVAHVVEPPKPGQTRRRKKTAEEIAAERAAKNPPPREEGAEGESEAAAPTEAAAAAEEIDEWIEEEVPPPSCDAENLPEMLRDADDELRRLVDLDHDSVNRDKHVWRTQEMLNGYASYIARERLQGRSVVVVDKKDVARYCKFAKNRFVDIGVKYKMPPADYVGMWHNFDQQLDALKNVLQKQYQDLRRIFTFYCRGKSLMSEADFWRFITDIRALDRTCTRHHVDRIFAIANDDEPPVPKNGKSFQIDEESSSDDESHEHKDDLDDVEVEDEENSETELIPSEFVECLIRIADRKFPGKQLHERFQHFMDVHVVPFACKSDTDKFKKEIQSAQTQTAVQKYQRELVKVFNYYAKGSRQTGKKKTKTMLLENFVHFMKEACVMSQSLDESAAASVFSTVSTSPDEANKEIDHREFLEAVVCMAVFKTPSPFVPLDKKVEVISSAVIGNLRAKLKPAVNLADMPIVTLKQS